MARMRVRHGGRMKIKWNSAGITSLYKSPELRKMLEELVEGTARRASADATAWFPGDASDFRKQPFKWQVSAASRGSSKGIRGAVIAQTLVGIRAESERAILTKAFRNAKLGE